jgi:transposase-like protein
MAARRFFRRALTTLKVRPSEVVTDTTPVYPRVLDELVPTASHKAKEYANNQIEADHSRLKHRLRPMRGLRTDRRGHHRRTRVRTEPSPGHYELEIGTVRHLRVAAAFTEVAQAI